MAWNDDDQRRRREDDDDDRDRWRRDEDDDEHYRRCGDRFLKKLIARGRWFMIVGGCLLVLGWLMNTTVESGTGLGRVYNIGLLASALSFVIAGLGFAIIGAIFYTVSHAARIINLSK
jgi:hypothetical protein